jgi:hypothetical protein
MVWFWHWCGVWLASLLSIVGSVQGVWEGLCIPCYETFSSLALYSQLVLCLWHLDEQYNIWSFGKCNPLFVSCTEGVRLVTHNYYHISIIVSVNGTSLGFKSMFEEATAWQYLEVCSFWWLYCDVCQYFHHLVWFNLLVCHNQWPRLKLWLAR